MPRILPLALGFILLPLGPRQARNPSALHSAQASASLSNAQKEILKLEEDRNQAILHGDAQVLNGTATDDYTFINTRGQLQSRQQVVDSFKSGAIKFETRQLSGLGVRVYGDTAVVTGLLDQKWTENGKERSGKFRFTRVYVRQNGTWLSAALQETTVAEH
jgi:uncharacterized protein (TIGR02246 family)